MVGILWACATLGVAFLTISIEGARSWDGQLDQDLANYLLSKQRGEDVISPQRGHMVAEKYWPQAKLRLGQIGGIEAADNGDLFVFHRGDHVWNAFSFNRTDSYRLRNKGPIREPTILRLNGEGKVVGRFGSNKFYLPHGLSLDNKGNIWVTDVALHQVFKFTPTPNSLELSLVLGEAFVPGTDQYHFCKPTDVAVASNGDFFVADGYCNSRVVKFSKSGSMLADWGKDTENDDRPKPDEFLVPHSLALLEDKNIICVADREHGRIQCFDAGLKQANKTGKFAFSISNPRFGKVFAISYNPKENVLYAVNGITRGIERAMGFTIDMDSKLVIDTWSPSEKGFFTPHDVANHGSSVFVGEIGPNFLWKFSEEPRRIKFNF